MTGFAVLWRNKGLDDWSAVPAQSALELPGTVFLVNVISARVGNFLGIFLLDPVQITYRHSSSSTAHY